MQSDDDRRLRRWFTEFNKKWWNGMLGDGAEIEVYFGTCEGDHGMYAYCEDYADEKVEGFEICIDQLWVTHDRIAKKWLLHEMAHVAVHPYPWEGIIFQNEMKRLALAGAFKGIW